jgi:hypothetical protein
MINQCANLTCSKPLHYLREGRIFVFDFSDSRAEPDSKGVRPRRLEHYWLCGECAQSYLLERTAENDIQVIPRRPVRSRRPTPITVNAARAS